jgi:Mn2+/Fe2+ NRAMP family transporter
MTLALFTYVIAAFLAHPDWRAVAHATFVPSFQSSSAYLTMFVALAGTTISPYLFFWQATQEVEEDREKGKTTLSQRKGATDQETRDSQIDVITGMGISNLIMYAIILTTAATLHAAGMTHIATTEQAAEALRPAGGKATYLLFALGIIGTGMLSVPVLAGSTAFALAEARKWRNSLRYRPYQAPEFYCVLFASLLVGAALNYVGLPAVGMLFWSAVLNGVMAPPLLALVIVMSSDRSVMGERVNGRALQVLGWLAFLVMATAAAAMLISL